MTDAEYAAQKARVQALIDAWVQPLGLSWWQWEYRWKRAPLEDAPDGTIFQIHVSFPYHRVTLEVCLPLVADQSDDDLEFAFVHECGHVFTIPLKDGAACGLEGEALDFLEEHQASAIARSLIWLRNHLTAPKE